MLVEIYSRTPGRTGLHVGVEKLGAFFQRASPKSTYISVTCKSDALCILISGEGQPEISMRDYRLGLSRNICMASGGELPFA